MALLLLGALVPAAQAQDYMDLAERFGRPSVYHEANVVPAAEGGHLVVSFRLPNALLVFLRDQERRTPHRFFADVTLAVQVLQGEKVVADQTWTGTQRAATFEDTHSRTLDLEGAVGFTLPPGAYHYRVRFNDAGTDRERRSAPTPVTIPDFSGALAVGRAMLATEMRAADNGVRMKLANVGGDAPFGQPVQAILPVRVEDVSVATLRYTLHHLPDADVDGEAGTLVREGVVAVEAGTPVPVTQPGFQNGALWWEAAPSAAGAYLVPVDLDGEHLGDGAYLLTTTLEQGGAAVRQETRFRTHWRNMPLSLHHPNVAIRTLEFVESRETIRAMRRGGREAQEAQFRAYWDARDPTPGTVFNELMAEYYRRVDEAATTFQTGRGGPDGLETDRAKVYIVYGKADAVERRFPPGGGVEEVWRYADGRRFVFWAATSLDPFQLRSSDTD